MEIFDSLRRVTSQKNLQNLGTCLKGGGGVGPKPQLNFFLSWEWEASWYAFLFTRGRGLGWVKKPLSHHSDLLAIFSHYQWLYKQNETKIRPNGHVLQIPPEFGDSRKSKGPPLVHEIFFSHKYRQYGYQKLCLGLTKWELKTKIQ